MPRLSRPSLYLVGCDRNVALLVYMAYSRARPVGWSVRSAGRDVRKAAPRPGAGGHQGAEPAPLPAATRGTGGPLRSTLVVSSPLNDQHAEGRRIEPGIRYKIFCVWLAPLAEHLLNTAPPDYHHYFFARQNRRFAGDDACAAPACALTERTGLGRRHGSAHSHDRAGGGAARGSGGAETE